MTLDLPPMSQFADTIYRNKYAHALAGGRKESWPDTAERVVENVCADLPPDRKARVKRFVTARKLMPGGRYLYAAGRKFPQVNNCFLFRAGDSREQWAELMSDVTTSLMTGGGVGCVYSDLRPEGDHVTGMGGSSTGPLALMRMVNEAGRYIMQGGSRRSAIWAGLHWWHPDVLKFIDMKQWSPAVHRCRAEDFNFPAPMDGTNISVIADTAFFQAIHTPGWSREYRLGGHAFSVTHARARDVYDRVTRNMLSTAEPGWSVDCGPNEGENLRNACTEVTSRYNRDMCNLASVNLARVDTLDEFHEVVQAGIDFLLCGTVYSKLPIEAMYAVREATRRLGLGLMGVHEWLLKRGLPYGPCDELARWMLVYSASGPYADGVADAMGLSRPVKTRSIAPTGTISIVAETTSGIEPVFAVAYKRRYLDGKEWKAQYVVDATAKRLIDGGVDPDLIEDAYTLAEDTGRRSEFQAWLQGFVDHGISSTINLPEWGSSLNNEATADDFGRRMLRTLPQLRGVTAYPDGSRGGQPLNRVSYRDAVKHLGTELLEERETGDQSCVNGFCSS